MRKIFAVFFAAALIILGTGSVFAATGKRIDASVASGEEKTAFYGYDVEGYKCFNIRDLAKALNGTECQFNIDWNGAGFCAEIKRGEAYTQADADNPLTVYKIYPSYSTEKLKFIVDDEEIITDGFCIGEKHYITIRDAAVLIGVDAQWQSERKVICMKKDGIVQAEIYAGVTDLINSSVIALTFDDGPQPGSTERILAALDKVGGHATFFVVGSRVKEYPETVKSIALQHSQIGCHSYNHTRLTELGAYAVQKEVYDTSNQVYSAAGVYTYIGRPPYGEINNTVKNAVTIKWFNWGTDTLDWKYRDSDYVYNYVMKYVHNGATILMHDLHVTTAAAMERAIPALAAKGFKFVTIDEMAELKGGYDKVEGYLG